MSKEIDQKVVEMRFDNRHFETNVRTTMSSLDKLKQSLKFKDAEKGFDNLNKSAKNVDMTHLGKGLDTVKAKFSAMEVIGVTALVNITNSAMAAGKKIVSALTIDPVRTGFKEYETQINAVQTIMANVGHKGKTLEDVNKALDELNEYADQTIYNFTEMTKNIGLFTNAGVGLDESVAAIKGFSNAAAMAGADSTRTAGAMYQLSQAMSSGKMQLMDWRSLEQANITGERFQETIKITARAHGIAIDDMIKKEGSLRDTLKSGWLTSDLMSEALEHYTLSTEHMTEEEQKANRERLRSIGYTEEQIDGLFKLGTEATNAATKVKTFTQLWDVLKEAAQSGWAKTWRIIVGDFEEAKALFTPLANFFTGIIDKMSDARNALLESALGKRFVDLSESLKKVVDPAKGVVDSIGGVINTLKDYNTLVDEIIAGKWGNAPTRFQDLTAAGYDYAHAQNLVNERLGNSYRRATNYTEAQQEATTATVEMTEATAKELEALTKKTEAELKALGYTDEQISAIKQLKKEADKLGLSVGDFLLQMDGLTGRQILLNSFKNIGQGLVKTFGAIGKAYREIFPPMTGDQLYNIIAAFHKFSLSCKMSDETADKLRRTFKGLFAIIDIILTVVGGPIKIAFKILGQILGMANVDILTLTAYIGDAIVKFRDFIDGVLDFTKIFEKIIPTIKNAVKAVGDWVKSLKESDNIPRDIALGLINGIKACFLGVGKVLVEFAKFIIDTVKKVLGIHSPSTVFFEIGKNIIEGLVNGIKYLVPAAIDIVTNLGYQIIESLRNLDIGDIINIAMIGGMIYAFKKLTDIVEMFAYPLKGLGDLLSGVGRVIEDVGEGLNKYFKAKAANERSKAILNLALAIGILAASVYVLSKISVNDLIKAGAALLGLTLIIAILSTVAKNAAKDGDGITKLGFVLIAMSVSMLLIVSAIKKLSFLNENNIWPIMGAFVAIGALITVFTNIAKKNTGASIAKTGSMLTSLGVSLLLMAWVIKIMGGMDTGTLIQGGICVAIFLGVIAGLMLLNKFGNAADGLGKLFIGIAAALISMAICVKMLGDMDNGTLIKGSLCVLAFVGIIALLMWSTKLLGTSAAKGLGVLFLGVSAALIAMALCVKILGNMDGTALLKGVGCIAAFSVLIMLLMGMASISDKKTILGIAATMTAVAVLMGVMAVLTVVLGLIPDKIIYKGLAVVAGIGAIISAILWVSKNAEKASGSIWAIAGLLAIMTASIYVLSTIKTDKLIVASAAIGVLMGIVAGILYVSKHAEKAMKPMIALAVVIGAIGGIIFLLGQLPVERTIASAAALGVLLGEMAIIIKTLSNIKVNNAIDAALSMLILCVPLVAFAAILWGMSALGVQNALKNAIALGVLLAAMAAVIHTLSVGKTNINSASKGALAMLALCAPLIGVAAALWVAKDVGNATDTAIALGVLLGEMAIITTTLSKAKVSINSAIQGALVMLTLCAPLIAIAAALALMKDVENATEKAVAIGILLAEMAVITIAAAALGPFAGPAISGIGAMIGVITILGAFIIAVGALMKYFPVIGTFVDKGIDLLVKLAEGVGEIIVAFASVIADFVIDTLPKFGEALGDFMEGAAPFIDGIKRADLSVLSGTANLSGAILLLVATDLINGIAKFFGVDFPGLGRDLSTFMSNAGTFFDEAHKINESAMRGIKYLAQAILIMTGDELLDSLTGWITGGDGVEEFSKSLPTIGKGIAGMHEHIKDISSKDIDKTKVAAECIKIMAESSKKIAKSGGLTSFLSGSTDYSGFSHDIGVMAETIKSFVDQTEGIDKETMERVKFGAEAIGAFAEAAGKVSSHDWMNKLFGVETTTSLDSFGVQVANVAGSLKTFTDTLGKDFGQDQWDALKFGAEAIVTFSDAAQKVNSKDWMNKLFGVEETSLTEFASTIPGVAESISSFATNLGDTFDETMQNKVKCGADAIAAFANAAATINNEEINWAKMFGGETTLADFGKELEDTAQCIVDFAKKVDELDEDSVASLNRGIDVIDTFIKFAQSLEKQTTLTGIGMLEEVATTAVMTMKALLPLNNIEGLNDDAILRIREFCIAVEELIPTLNALPEDGAKGKQFGELGAQLNDLAEGLWDFQNTLNQEGFNATTCKTQAENVCEIIGVFADNATDASIAGLKTISTDAVTIGEKINSFVKKVKDVGDDSDTKVTNVCDVIKALLTATSGITNPVGAGQLQSFCDTIANVQTNLADLKKALDGFTGAESISTITTNFAQVGSAMINGVVNGVNANPDSVTSAMNTVKDSALGKLTGKTVIDEFKTAGKNVVTGFANGITLNKYISDNAAIAMAQSAIDKAKETTDQNSPSREFMEIGKFTVLGFAKGITDNIGISNKASVGLGMGALHAIQDALGIHSPAIEFKEGVGRWIAVGVAEGITKDMSAEEAAEKKAQNIVSAFQKGLHDIDLKINISTNEHELWKQSNDATYANEAIRLAKEEAYLTEQYNFANEKAKMLNDRLTQTRQLFDDGKLLYTAVLEAHAEWSAAQREANEALAELDNFKTNKVTDQLEAVVNDNEQAIQNREKLHNLWLKENKKASEEDKNLKEYELATGNLRNLENMHKTALAEHEYLVETNATSEAIQKQWDKCRDIEERIADTKAEIVNIRQKNSQIEIDELETQMGFRDQQLDILKAELGKDLTPEELENLERAHLTDELADLVRQADVEFEQWAELKKAYEKGDANLADVEQAKREYYDAVLKRLNTKNELADLDAEAAEREKEALKQRYELAEETADLQYQIWEATAGKDATGAEKDLKKIGMLQKQLQAQTGLMIEAEKEWKEAANDHTKSKNEVQEAYNAYLQQQLNVANLQSEISDLHEKAVTRERAAAAEYKDYVKKYAKYYEENGMSKSMLEKDAKLVSGYDGNSTVNKILSSSSKALNNLESNPLYTETINGYTALGETYLDAMSAGFDTGTAAFATACIDMMNQCIAKLEPTKESWIQVGKNCVDGFVKGIEDNTWMAVKAATTMARDALTAANETFDAHSPAREFIKLGKYAAQGLAIGLSDNSDLSSAAATSLGEETINSLKDTIALINDVVTSEIDSQPTIRPVLDVSDVKSKAAKLNTMFSNSLAVDVGARMAKTTKVDSSQNGVNNNTTGNTYQFTQNNYSPKALSRAEIYRQTKNQFAAMKGALK